MIVRANLKFYQPEEFRPRHEQLATQSAAGAQLSALDEAIDAEIIDAEEAGRFMHGVSKSFRLGCESFCRRWSNGRFHRSKTRTLGVGVGHSAPAMERAFPATLLMTIAAEESDL